MMVASTIAPVATVSPLAAKLPLHLVEQPPAQIVLLEQVAETAHRGLVRRRFATEVDPDKKAAHRPRIVKRLFDRRVRQVEPVLQQIDAQHPPDINRRRATAGLWIERLDQRAQRRPRHNPLHLTEKRRPLRRLGVTFEPHCRKGQQLHPPTHPHQTSYHAHSSRLLQRFPNSFGRQPLAAAHAIFKSCRRESRKRDTPSSITVVFQRRHCDISLAIP